MSLDLLRRIASHHLPYLASSPEEIDQVAALRTEGLVSALVPERDDDGYLAHATVLRLTDKARAVLLLDPGPPGLPRGDYLPH